MLPSETFAKHGGGHGHGGHGRQLHVHAHAGHHGGHWHGRSVHRDTRQLAWSQLAWTWPSALGARSMVGLWCWPLLASGSRRLGLGLFLTALIKEAAAGAGWLSGAAYATSWRDAGWWYAK